MLSACSAYGQACGAGCCGGLVCDANGKCNQPAAVCDNMPSSWQSPPPPSQAAGPTVGSPLESVQAQAEGGNGAAVGAASGVYRVGWFSDWNILGIIGVMISILIIAFAAMIGHAFNLSEVKAFASSEMMQAVISILLIAGLLALVQFFNIVALEAVDIMDMPVNCAGSSAPCYLTVAIEYLNNVQGVADQYSQNSLKESFDRMATAMTGMNTQANVWWMAFAGVNTRINAGESIEAERAGAMFEATSKLMVSLYAQKYFLEVVSFGIAPVLLLLGIILRTFFFTRKLGGLLLAIAIALFIVYPLAFSFAWLTLNVTVYGDRTIASIDPSCPSECTAKYPVAFYASEGKLIQFESTQDIVRAGITQENWANGGPDTNNDGTNDYQGLVACRSLAGVGIDAAPSCAGCPDYCREVPFPVGMPGCNISVCANCNAGCKLMRQRSDCAAVCGQSQCSPECLTTQPVENKCYYAADSAVVQADLSVSCAGCDTCPNWCKIVSFNSATGKYEPVNKGEAPCQIAACIPTGTTLNGIAGTCPLKCLYVSGIVGNDNNCNTLCTDQQSGSVCPNYCRIKDLSTLGDYDTGGNPLIPLCTGDAPNEFGAACSVCPDVCKISVLPEGTEAGAVNNLSNCAPYPKKDDSAQNCLSCPLYCRFTTFVNYTGFSNLATEYLGLTTPAMCAQNALLGLNCTSPSACDGSCKGAQTSQLCLQYDVGAAQPKFCNMCPDETRGMMLQQVGGAGPRQVRSAPVAPSFSADVATSCATANCAPSCKPTRIFEIPNEDANAACKNYVGGANHSDCQACPVACRVSLSNNNWLDAACSNTYFCSDADCTAACKASAAAPPQPPTFCLGYQGNGPVQWNQLGCYDANGNKQNYDSEETCLAANANYYWGFPVNLFSCLGAPTNPQSPACNTYADFESCSATPGCAWDLPWSLNVPIANRAASYDNSTNCQQCPENCRVRYADGSAYEGACGMADENSTRYVDCSLASCGMSCRSLVTTPAPPAELPSVCLAPAISTKPCASCPAFCRRSNASSPPGNVPYCDSSFCGADACIDSCRLPEPPKKACEGCVECISDCLYTPPTRTDCSDVCTNEALAGPINVGPQDFVKNLPGASGRADVKGVGLLMLPALVLPLFCIVIVISFIRVLSPILGGDIEIPGIGRII